MDITNEINNTKNIKTDPDRFIITNSVLNNLKTEFTDHKSVPIDIKTEPIESIDPAPIANCIKIEPEQFLIDNKFVESPRKIKKEPDDQFLNCPQCSKTFRLTNSLYKHIKISHPTYTRKIKPVPCTKCPRSYGSTKALRVHTLNAHSGSQQTQIKTTSRLNSSKKHAKCTEKKSTCQKCLKSFSSPKLLKNHIASAHPLGRKPRKQQKLFSCVKCSASYAHLRTLKRHVKEDHLDLHAKKAVEVCINCSICKELFVRVTCQVCEKRFVSNVFMDAHLKELPGCFECEVCGEVFAWRMCREFHVFKVHEEGEVDADVNRCNKCLKYCKLAT